MTSPQSGKPTAKQRKESLRVSVSLGANPVRRYSLFFSPRSRDDGRGRLAKFRALNPGFWNGTIEGGPRTSLFTRYFPKRVPSDFQYALLLLLFIPPHPTSFSASFPLAVEPSARYLGVAAVRLFCLFCFLGVGLSLFLCRSWEGRTRRD